MDGVECDDLIAVAEEAEARVNVLTQEYWDSPELTAEERIGAIAEVKRKTEQKHDTELVRDQPTQYSACLRALQTLHGARAAALLAATLAAAQLVRIYITNITRAATA